MAFQGNCSTFTIPDLLSFIFHQKLSGRLIIVSSEKERAFVFRRGELAYAVVNDPGQLLGEILVRELELSGLVVEQLAAASGEKRFLGEELVRRGFVSADDINEVMGRQVRRSLREVLRWQRWAFHFQDLDPDERIPQLSICTRSLVFDLIRELDEWASVQEIFPDLSAIISRKPGSFRSTRPPRWEPELPPPGKVVMQIDGQRSVKEVLEESPYPVRPFAIGLGQLIESNLLQIRQPPASSKSRSPESPPTLPLAIIPNLPARTVALVNSGNDSLCNLRELIVSDPMLLARTLRLASFRHSAAPREPFCLNAILKRIDRPTLRTLILAESVRAVHLSPSISTWYQHWDQTYTASQACRQLAEYIGYSEPDLAQAGGLIQDIGCLMMAQLHGSAYRRFDASHPASEDLVEAEKREFHTHHCRLGTQLADYWEFPPALKTVIREHHSPLDHPQNQLLGIVRLGNAIAASRHLEHPAITKDNKRLARRLGVSIQDLGYIHGRVRHSGEILATSANPLIIPV